MRWRFPTSLQPRRWLASGSARGAAPSADWSPVLQRQADQLDPQRRRRRRYSTYALAFAPHFSAHTFLAIRRSWSRTCPAPAASERCSTCRASPPRTAPPSGWCIRACRSRRSTASRARASIRGRWLDRQHQCGDRHLRVLDRFRDHHLAGSLGQGVHRGRHRRGLADGDHAGHARQAVRHIKVISGYKGGNDDLSGDGARRRVLGAAAAG